MGKTNRAALARDLHELAAFYGWRRHDHTGRTSEGHSDGFPAEVLLRGERLLFVEFTDGRGVLIPPAREWFAALAAVSAIDTFVLGPDDAEALAQMLSVPA